MGFDRLVLTTPHQNQIKTKHQIGNPSIHPDGTQVFVGDEEGGLLALNAMTGEAVRCRVYACVYVCMTI